MDNIIRGIELFNDADFFAAHDFFEDLWIDSNTDQKFFYQGLVHVSVACFHLISGNVTGALSQYSKGKMKLEKYVPDYAGVDVENLIVSINKIVSEIQIGGKNNIPEDLVNKLPKINYSK